MKIGCLFWRQVRADYSDDSGESASLQVSDPPPAEAFKHLCSVISAKPKRAAFRMWLIGKEQLSKDENVILVKILSALNPHAVVGDQFETGVAILEAWCRRKSLSAHPEVIRTAIARIDTILCKASVKPPFPPIVLRTETEKL
eukprot:110417-Amphidinium_carterae.4